MKRLFILIYILIVSQISLFANDTKDLKELLANFKMPFDSQYLEIEQIILEDKFDPDNQYLKKLDKIKMFTNSYGNYTHYYEPIEGVSVESIWYSPKDDVSYNIYPNGGNAFASKSGSPLYKNTANCFNVDVLFENKCEIKKSDKNTIISTTSKSNYSYIYTFDKDCMNLLKKEIFDLQGLCYLYEIEQDDSNMTIHYRLFSVKNSQKEEFLFNEKIVKYKVVPAFELKWLKSENGLYTCFIPKSWKGFDFNVNKSALKSDNS